MKAYQLPLVALVTLAGSLGRSRSGPRYGQSVSSRSNSRGSVAIMRVKLSERRAFAGIEVAFAR